MTILKFGDESDDAMSSLGVILVEAPAPKASQIAMERASAHTLVVIIMMTRVQLVVMIIMIFIISHTVGMIWLWYPAQTLGLIETAGVELPPEAFI